MNRKQIIDLARELRKNQTPEEKLLWQFLRNRKLKGVKFLRQHPITYQNLNNDFQFFIPDFYSAEKKLIIEVDGKIHDFQQEYDQSREEILKGLGLNVIRFKNEELQDITKVLNLIKELL